MKFHLQQNEEIVKKSIGDISVPEVYLSQDLLVSLLLHLLYQQLQSQSSQLGL